jgi:hypothetical protein
LNLKPAAFNFDGKTLLEPKASTENSPRAIFNAIAGT